MKPALSRSAEAPHPNRPPANFDRVARLYRWAEYLTLGPLLTRTRRQFLEEVSTSRVACVFGDGDGRFAAALLRRAPRLRLHAIDSSAGMLDLLRQRCLHDGTLRRLSTEQVLAEAADLPRECDLIVTHFLLDCLPQYEVNRLAARLGAQAKPGCRWLVSEFGLPRGRWARLAASLYIRLLYLAFRVLTGLRTGGLPDPAHALTLAGFVRIARVERLGGLLYAELWELPPTFPPPHGM